jgi:monoamine oxidase
MRATVVGGGIAGLAASVASAEPGGQVQLFEARCRLVERARSSSGPFVTHFGPYALYCDGPWCAWLAEPQLLPATARPPLMPRTLKKRARAARASVAAVTRTTRSVRLLAGVYTMTTERVSSQ